MNNRGGHPNHHVFPSLAGPWPGYMAGAHSVLSPPPRFPYSVTGARTHQGYVPGGVVHGPAPYATYARSPSPSLHSRSSLDYSTSERRSRISTSMPRHRSQDDVLEPDPVVFNVGFTFRMGKEAHVHKHLEARPAYTIADAPSSRLTRQIDKFLKKSDHSLDRYNSVIDSRSSSRLAGRRGKSLTPGCGLDDDDSPDCSMSLSRRAQRSASAASIAVKAERHLESMGRIGRGGGGSGRMTAPIAEHEEDDLDTSSSDSLDEFDTDDDVPRSADVFDISDDTSADFSKLSAIDVDGGTEHSVSFDPSRLDDLSSDSDDEYFDVVAVPGLRPYLPAAQNPTKPPTPQHQLQQSVQPPHIPPTHSRSLPAVNKGMVENRMGNNQGQQIGTITVAKQSSTSVAARNTTQESFTSLVDTEPTDNITKQVQQPPTNSSNKLMQQTLPSADVSGSTKNKAPKSPTILTVSKAGVSTRKEGVQTSPKKYQAPQPPSATQHPTDKQQTILPDKQDSTEKLGQHKMTDNRKAHSSLKKYAAPQPPGSSSLSRPSILMEHQSSAAPLTSSKQNDKGGNPVMIKEEISSSLSPQGTHQITSAPPDMLGNKQTVSISTDKTLAKITQQPQEGKGSCSATLVRKVRAGSPVPDNTTVVGIKIAPAIITGKLEIAPNDGSATVKKDSTAVDMMTLDIEMNGTNEDTATKGISTVEDTSSLESNQQTNKQACITETKINQCNSKESESKMANGLLVASTHKEYSVSNGKDQDGPQTDRISIGKKKQNDDRQIGDENDKNLKEKKGKLKEDEVNSVDSHDDRSSRCSSVVSDLSRAVSPDSSQRSGAKRSKSGKLAAIMNKWETDEVSQISEKGKSKSSAAPKVGKISNLASVFEGGKSVVTPKTDTSKSIGKLKSPYSAPFSPERKAPEVKTSNIAGINTAKFGGVTKFKKPGEGKKEDGKNVPSTERTKEVDKDKVSSENLSKQNTSSIKKIDEKKDIDSRKSGEDIPHKNQKEEKDEKKIDKNISVPSMEKCGEKIANGDVKLVDSDISLTSISEDGGKEKKKKSKKRENESTTSTNVAVSSAVENGLDIKLHEAETFKSKSVEDEASKSKDIGVKATEHKDMKVEAIKYKTAGVKDAESNITKVKVKESKTIKDEDTESKSIKVKATRDESIVAKSVSVKVTDAKVTNSEVTDAKATNVEDIVAKSTSVKVSDAKVTNSEVTDAKATSVEDIVAKSTSVKVSDAKVTNSEVTDAKATSVEDIFAKSTSVKVTDAKVTNSEVTDAKATSVEDIVAKSSSVKVTDAKATNVENIVAKSASVKVTDTKVTNSEVTDTKKTHCKATGVEPIVAKAASVKVTDAKVTNGETFDIKATGVEFTDAKTNSIETTDAKVKFVKTIDAKASSVETTDEKIADIVNAKKINIEATDAKATNAEATSDQVTITKGVSARGTKTENTDSPNTRGAEMNVSITNIAGSCVAGTNLKIASAVDNEARLKTSKDSHFKAHTLESDVSTMKHASTKEKDDKAPESTREKDLPKREMFGGIKSFMESVGIQFGTKSIRTENLTEAVHNQHQNILNHVVDNSSEVTELLGGKPSLDSVLSETILPTTSDQNYPQKTPEVRQNLNDVIPKTTKALTEHRSEVETLIKEASYLIEQNKNITEPSTSGILHASFPKVETQFHLRKHHKSLGEEGEEEVYVDAIDPSQLDTLMPLPKMENERECRSRSRTPLEGPERSPSSRSVVAQTEALLSETDRLLRRSRSDKSLRRSYSRSLSSAALNKSAQLVLEAKSELQRYGIVCSLAEVTADLSEEHNTAHLAGERLEAEQTERMKLEKEIERLQTDMRLMTTANGKLEMEKQALRSEVLTVANINGDADHDDDDAAEASLYKRKYEWCLREIELLKKQLKQQQEDDLDHLLLTKKQLEKKVADAYEETEEQRQVVAQMKRKSQRLQAEMNDLKILLEEQTSRNNLLEKKQRKFDQDVMAVQEELRHERANKDKIQRERDQILSEKYSFEQEVSTLKLELELKEEKISALNRELEDLSFTGKAEEEVATLKKAKHDLELRVKDQEEELDDLAGQVQMLEGAKVRLEMSIEQMRKENRREVQQRDEELEEVRISAQKKVKALEAQLENEHDERTHLVREKHELERRLAELHDRTITHVDEDYVHKLKKELKKTKALLRDTQTMLEKSQSEGGHKLLVRQLKTQLEDAEFAKTAAIKARQCAEADLSELSTQLEEAQRTRKEAEDRCARIAKDKAEIQTQLEESEEEVAEVMKKYKSVVSQLSVDQITLSEQSQQIAELEHEKQVLQERMLELSSKVEVLEGETANIHTQRRLEMKIKEVESKLELEQTTRQRLESQIGRLKDQIERLTSECDSARLKETQALEQSKRVSRQLREAKEDLSALQQRHTDAINKKGELEKQLELADSEVATLKSDLKLAFKRIEDLQQAIQGDINDSDSDLSDSDSDSDGSLSSYLTASLRQQRSSSNSTLRTPPSEVQQLERLEQPNSPCSEAMSAISEDLDDASTKESYA